MPQTEPSDAEPDFNNPVTPPRRTRSLSRTPRQRTPRPRTRTRSPTQNHISLPMADNPNQQPVYQMDAGTIQALINALNAAQPAPGAPAAPGAARKYLPTPQCRDAPVFKGEEPQNLYRFLERYETVCEQAKVTGHRDKITKIMQYADPQSEAEWKGFKTYVNEDSTWEEFKRELINNYPEAVDQEEGSIHKLERVCNKYDGSISMTELPEFMAFKRAFVAQAIKILKVTPPLISNQQLVRLFQKALDADFRVMINNRLQMLPVPALAEGEAPRRRDDMWDYELVIQTAYDIANNAVGSYEQGIAVGLRPSPSSRLESTTSSTSVPPSTLAALRPIKEEMDSLKQDMVAVKDQLNVQRHTAESNHAQMMKVLTQKSATPQQTYANGGSAHNNGPPPRNYNNNNSNAASPQGEGCWFCEDPTHFAQQCPPRKDFESRGLLKFIAGKYFLSDGRRVEKTPGLSWKQRVEAQSAIKDPLSVHYFNSLFDADVEEDNHLDTIAQLQQEMGQLRTQFNLNSQSAVNSVYQSNAQNQTLNGGTPSILRRETNVVYNNEMAPGDQFMGTRNSPNF